MSLGIIADFICVLEHSSLNGVYQNSNLVGTWDMSIFSRTIFGATDAESMTALSYWCIGSSGEKNNDPALNPINIEFLESIAKETILNLSIAD